jgi:UPF0716 family protein affecting phage T7 exclusion
MNKSLTRSIGFWLLLVLAIASTAVGGWLISGQIDTMTTTLADGTATGVEVYVGQSLVVVGAALLGAGIVGILLAAALVAVQALLPVRTPVAVEPIDWTTASEPENARSEGIVAAEAAVAETSSAAADASADDADADTRDSTTDESSPAITR